ncbi:MULTISPECIES: DUF4164 family protein [Nitrospirillum]|uniref:DUF4164 domain-containing protein n=2 Tax=Nitrospirillum TaxID=1543705 RepID=A0A248JQK7_9PROT|nr:DUF4164 family protein [Nitrospirillum amazonense]ASG21043.1 hypothetical protein Y958_09555 [Nitrospirillum amazonense CBAmc]EGY00758.1 hypothetical protein AZA_89241 [Nitrospirillum amazonense Y2]MDG3441986.1 DUF4164 family protein [Nitrospirillum amazonense]TWB32459.1 uncharacterized protein DUF4164 [Nitrospirillum amazonense]TWB47789.1 uncharacterized protein DUF4164 [Nitrospirillum amazonense]
MERLKTALERLDAAVLVLDGALERRLAQPAAVAGDVDEAAKARIAQLERALAAAEGREQGAKAATAALSERLDRTIGQLRAVLED